MTSLSEQLKRLELPQTNVFRKDKERASLLFDPKEAAGLKRETVYQIGLDGLEELISKDQTFEHYKNSLFHITSRKFERSVQTPEANKKLDETIRKFLFQLSPYFLLNCSHKSLEWLINRYSIHEFNRDDFLLSVIPYHESNIFVRVIQLMKFKDQRDSWIFLKPLQQNGLHLTKQGLITHAASDVGFLKLVRKFIKLSIKYVEKPSLLTVGFNFYCAVYTGTIEFSKDINENQISQMLPTLLKGLNSEIPDFTAASYVILGRLLMKTTFSDTALDKFVEKLVDTKVESLTTESILLLLILYQFQPQYVSIPEESCNILIHKEGLLYILQSLMNGKYCETPFLQVLVKECFNWGVKEDKEIYREFVKKLMSAVKFEDDFVQTFLRLLLGSTQNKDRYSDHLQRFLKETIETLERQYPNQFDKEVASRESEKFKDNKSSNELPKQPINDIELLKAGRLSIDTFRNLMIKTQKPETDLGRIDIHKNLEFLKFTEAIFTSPKKKYLEFFLSYYCKDLRSKLEFVLNLSTSGIFKNFKFFSQCVDLLLQLVTDSEELELLFQNGGILPYILAPLIQKCQKSKEKMFELIECLSKSVGKQNYKGLFTELLEQKEEVVADSDQMALIFFNYLETLGEKASRNLKNLIIEAACGDHPVYLKAKMLELLSHVNTIDLFETTAKDCLDLFENSVSFDPVHSTIIYRNLTRCHSSIAQYITTKSFVWKLIETCLKNDHLTIILDSPTNFVTVLLLEQIDKDFFNQLNEDVKLRLLDLVVERATLTKNAQVQSMIKHFVKVVELDTKLILPQLIAMRDVQSPKLDQKKLKRRISVVPTIDILDTLEWRKGIAALEFIQAKKKLRNIASLMPVLIGVLKKCLDFDEQAAVEYPKQLILSSILDLGTKINKDQLSEAMFNIELIVQCIRASQNPQTHYCALLVLAFSAELFPTQVLHHIMAIFTFMGSSLLRHEDAYSFQIISKIIDTIIPILIKDSNSETVAGVLRVFVDVLLDVPEHRRLLIYGQLLEKVGVTDYLYVFLLILFESHITHKKDDEKRLEIAANICREFPPKVVIKNCIHLLKYLKELPDEVEGDNTSFKFDVKFKTPKQFRHYKYTLITFTAKLLSSKEFVIQIASLTQDDLLELEQLYKDMIINVLTYIHRVSQISDRNATTLQAKYWKVILHLSYDILDSVNAILTPQMFLLVIKGLMLHNFNTVRRRSIELLNSKLQNDIGFFANCSSEEIYSLVPPLLSITKDAGKNEKESEEELITQNALLALKLLVKLLAEEKHEKLVEILDFLIDIAKSDKLQSNVLASLLLCVSEFFSNLRAHAISSLPTFLPTLLKFLKQQNNQDTSNLLLLSTLTAIQKILTTLPLFLSPYLENLLFELSLSATREDKSQPMINKFAILSQQIGACIPSRILIPVLGQSYKKLICKKEYSAISFLMEVLAENLNNLTGNGIKSILPELTSFFFSALQFRTDESTNFKEANTVESQIVDAFIKLILKLSESSFKPIFYKLFDWGAKHEEKSEKLITFYVLTERISESLKSLFVNFAGYFFNNCAQILDNLNTSKSTLLYPDDDKNIFLLRNVLKTLHTIFLYDNQRFVNKDRFHTLLQPLVDQLENTLADDLNEKFVTPTVVQFAVGAADDSLWKQLNYQILLKMKHNSPTIRLNSLFCLKEVVKKLGMDYLPLLPEAIPVLAELLEDEEEGVENACRKAVQEMEKILGEPIEKYFKM